MALTVETGTGLPDAESYVSVAEADAYHAARLNTLWAIMSTVEKEASLRRATDYMLQAYAGAWGGIRSTDEQALDWPRYAVERRDFRLVGEWPSDEVPRAVRQACALMAFKAAMGELAQDIGAAVKREKVGPIEVEYQEGARQTVRYLAIDRMLAPFLQGGGASSFVRVTRA